MTCKSTVSTCLSSVAVHTTALLTIAPEALGLTPRSRPVLRSAALAWKVILTSARLGAGLHRHRVRRLLGRWGKAVLQSSRVRPRALRCGVRHA